MYWYTVVSSNAYTVVRSNSQVMTLDNNMNKVKYILVIHFGRINQNQFMVFIKLGTCVEHVEYFFFYYSNKQYTVVPL